MYEQSPHTTVVAKDLDHSNNPVIEIPMFVILAYIFFLSSCVLFKINSCDYLKPYILLAKNIVNSKKKIS